MADIGANSSTALLSLSTHSRDRFLWVFGGSVELCNHIVEHDKNNFEYFKLYKLNMQATEFVGKTFNILKKDTIVGECGICLVDVEAQDNYSLTCHHVFCRDCIEDYISRKINQAHTSQTQLVCPGEGCTMPYNSYHIWRATGEDVEGDLFTKYLTFNVMRAFESSPFVRYCSNKECNHMIIIKPFKRRYVCRKCGTKSCAKCKRKYHKLPFCREKNSVKNFMYNLTKDTQACPRCRFLIQRSAGCDHMTCSKCSYYFCWKCGGDLNGNHVCLGNVKASCTIWGPLAPFKIAYEITKDVGFTLGVSLGVVFFSPAIAYFGFREWRENR